MSRFAELRKIPSEGRCRHKTSDSLVVERTNIPTLNKYSPDKFASFIRSEIGSIENKLSKIVNPLFGVMGYGNGHKRRELTFSGEQETIWIRPADYLKAAEIGDFSTEHSPAIRQFVASLVNRFQNG